MMHKGWSSIEEVPSCFARSSVKFQGRTSLKIVEFDPNWAFPDCISNLSSPMATKWRIKLKYHRRGALLFFKVIRQIARSLGSKNRRFWPKLGVSGLYLQFKSPMVGKWCTKLEVAEEVPYCFSRSSVKFLGRTALKIVEFDPDWAFPDCNSSLNSPMATKCCTKLEVA